MCTHSTVSPTPGSVVSTPPTPWAVSAVCVSVSVSIKVSTWERVVSIKVSSWERAICPLQCHPAPEAGFGEAGPPLWAQRAWGGCSPCYPPLSKWELGGATERRGAQSPGLGVTSTPRPSGMTVSEGLLAPAVPPVPWEGVGQHFHGTHWVLSLTTAPAATPPLAMATCPRRAHEASGVCGTRLTIK